MIVIDVEERGDWQVLAVAGELDVATTPRVRNEIVRLVADGATRLVLDLSRVDFIDSFGLGVLVGALKRVRSHGGEMRVVITEPRVLKVVELTGLDRVLELADSVDDVVGA
ncbi:MAG: STAS domain-containing protein [Acidimicrobiales bacterium]